MRQSTRKEFLQTSAVLLAAAVAGSSFDVIKYKPLLSFSTLGCPDWTFQQIVDFAVQHKYTGVELRGIQREMNLTKCNIFNSEHIADTLQLMKDKGLNFVDLGSSATLHFAEGEEREKGKREGTAGRGNEEKEYNRPSLVMQEILKVSSVKPRFDPIWLFNIIKKIKR